MRKELLGTMLERAEAKGYAQAVKDVVAHLETLPYPDHLTAGKISDKFESRFSGGLADE